MSTLKQAAAQAMTHLIRFGGLFAAALLAGIGPVSAATGDQLAYFDATSVDVPACASTNGSGVAHDGTNLILSCWDSNVLERVSGTWGSFANAGPITITGLSAGGLGALDWDPGRQKLWACNRDQQVVLIDMTAGSVVQSFAVPGAGCTDGLAYDASDDSLWMTKSANDDNWVIYHYKANGTFLAQFDVDPLAIFAYPPSGIAVACNQLYISGHDQTHVLVGPKTLGSATAFFQPDPNNAFMSDLTLDSHSFSGKSALWVLDRNSRRLWAAELPDCNLPPVCTAAAADPAALWPPNHKYVKIGITGVTDPDGDPITITATSVRQDEIVKGNGLGSGNTDPDATLIPLAVRAERNGNPKTPGNGRVYHIGFTASDGHGGTCTGTALVCVPHDQRPTGVCIDGGPLYDSLKP